jgi:NADH-quinone oxidoreductase subunit N
MMFLACGTDLIVLLLSLEIMALSLYVLTGFLRGNKRSIEASLKYFVLSAFSTAILAYGFSLLYGVGFSTNIFQIGDILDRRLRYTFAHHQVDWMFVLAFVTVAAGLFFKIGAVPFHQWAPDVCEGAPTPISAYVSTASILAGFAVFLRLVFYVFGSVHPTWVYLVAAVAIASLAWGNLAALTQNNLKRLLAYSSISHVGYILLGLDAWDPTMQSNTAVTGIFYYLIAYGFMTIGVFAVIVVLHQRGVVGDSLDSLDGLYQRSPVAAVLLLIFMCSLAGIPPTAGFMGKYFIFQALIEANHPVLASCAVLFLLPGLYAYFRVVHHAWMRGPGDAPAPQMSSAQAVVLGVTLFVTLAAGLYPEPFTRLARYAFGQ